MPWHRVSCGRVQTCDDKLWRATNNKCVYYLVFRHVEHAYLTTTKRDEAKLPITGNGDGLRSVMQWKYAFGFMRRYECTHVNWREYIYLVMLLIGNIYLTCSSVIVHWTKVSSCEELRERLIR